MLKTWLAFKFLLRRINCLAAVLMIFALHAGMAMGATGIRALDTPSLAVTTPGKVVFIAIANAGSRLVAVGEHGVIIYSDDNGQSWKQAKVPVDVTLTAVAFADAKNGWAVGHYGVILHTADGGADWDEQLNGIAVNQLILAAAQQSDASHSTAITAPAALRRAQAFTEAGPDKPFMTLQVIDANNVLVFGAYRLAVKTTDGGKTWVDWSLNIGDAISHNLYSSANIGGMEYVVGEIGLIFRSTDQGATFPALASSPTQTTLFVVLPAGANGVFIAGVSGQAFRSGDNGATWTQVNVPVTSNLDAGLVLKSGAILLGSSAGGLFISYDEGATFGAVANPPPMGIFGLAQAANGDVVAVGFPGYAVIPAATLAKN